MPILEIIILIIIGSLLGIVTGLLPGIHPNLVAITAISLSPLLLNYTSPLNLAIIIISMSIVNTFLDFIPSTYLGAPNEDTALSVLPAHSLLLKGKGYEAVKLATIGSLFGLLIIIFISPLLIILVKKFYPIIQTYIPFILLASVIILILKEKAPKLTTLTIILLASTLGLITLNLKTLSQPLFPLLSGLFGLSTLIISLRETNFIPKQFITDKIDLQPKKLVHSLLSSILGSCLTGFLPGLSSSQAAIISSSFIKKLETKYFIIIVGSINTVIMIISLIAFYAINKARNGSIVAVTNLVPSMTINLLVLFIAVALITAPIATFLTLRLARMFSFIITKINYKILCISIITLILFLTIFLTSYIGLVILITATFIGMLPPLLNTGRNHLMACLIIPIIFYFLL